MGGMIVDVLELTKKFVSTPGHLEYPLLEQEIALKVADVFQSADIPCELYEIAPNRKVVKGILKGTGGGRNLVFNTHLDTVPAYGMTDAFFPSVKDGRLYGRGACDARGPLACICGAIIALKQRDKLKGDVILLATCDEESGSLGARQVLPNLQADGAVVCEPTGLQIAIAQKGVEWFEVRFSGVSAHGGSPDTGHNAVYDAARFVECLENFDRDVLSKRSNPLVGRSTLNVGVIRGGNKHTVVPAECTVGFDRRWLPTETRDEVCGELYTLLKHSGGNAQFSCILGSETHPFSPMETSSEHPLVQAAMYAWKEVSGTEGLISGVPFWTEAALFHDLAHIPAIIVGPGYSSQAHSDNEYVEISQLELAQEFYMCIAVKFCNIT